MISVSVLFFPNSVATPYSAVAGLCCLKAPIPDLDKLLSLEQPAGILEFAERCSDDVFGFREVPAGSANSLAALHAGIGLFNLCGAAMPLYRIASIRSYIASCQTGIGGFGRTPGAIATLEDTWLALDCLQNLSAS